MLKIVLFVLGGIVALFLLYVAVIAVAALCVDPKKLYARDSAFYRFLLYSATWLCMQLLHIRVTVTGAEKLPNGRFLLVANHRSNFDPIVTWHVLPHRDLAFISKPENFHIPLFGRIVRRCCFMPIDRENARAAVSTINAAAELLKTDAVSVAVYPEGTRSKTGVLLPFHDGVFKIAQKAKVPIVVAVTEGTDRIAKTNFFRRKTVKLEILETLAVEDIAACRSHVIGDRVRQTMLQALPQNDVEEKESHAVSRSV